MTEHKRGLIARLRAHRDKLERKQRRPDETAKRIRLRVPVHVTESGRKAKRMVFRSLVVREGDVQRGGRPRPLV